MTIPERSARASSILLVLGGIELALKDNRFSKQSQMQIPIPDIHGFPLEAPSKLILTKSTEEGCHLIWDLSTNCLLCVDAMKGGTKMYFQIFIKLLSHWVKLKF